MRCLSVGSLVAATANASKAITIATARVHRREYAQHILYVGRDFEETIMDAGALEVVVAAHAAHRRAMESALHLSGPRMAFAVRCRRPQLIAQVPIARQCLGHVRVVQQLLSAEV
jgi:hypothetical protein